MSSDNYYMVRKIGDHYGVAMGFMSDGDCSCTDGMCACEQTGAPLDFNRTFATLEGALKYASEEYSEYGVILDPNVYEEVMSG